LSETWIRRLLYFTGGWNIVGGLSALIDPGSHFAGLYRSALSLEDPIQAFFFRATWINVIAWGVGYLLAARMPAARGPVLLAGAAGKLAYFGACLALYLAGAGSAAFLMFGGLDLFFVVLFVYALSRPAGITAPA
jgi:hypothetical protein